MPTTNALLCLISNIHFLFIDISRTSLLMDDFSFTIFDSYSVMIYCEHNTSPSSQRPCRGWRGETGVTETCTRDDRRRLGGDSGCTGVTETCTRDDRRRLWGDSGCTGVTETCTRDDRRRLGVTVGVQGMPARS